MRMVWEFNRLGNVPYLTDYDEGMAMFHVTYLLPPEADEGMSKDFYRAVLPVFGMPAQAIRHSKGYGLEMREDDGLVRKIWSEIEDPNDPGMRERIPKMVGFGSFGDFFVFAKYAVGRLPKIAQEVVLPEEECRCALPLYAYGRRRLLAEEISAIDWKTLQETAIEDFYRAFCASVERSLRKPSGRKLSPSEASQLIELVGPLK